MPNAALYSLAQQSGLSLEKVEDYWEKAKNIADEDGKKEDHAFTMGILKKMLGMKESIERPQLVDYFSRTVELLESKDESSEPQKWNKPYLAKVKSVLMEFDTKNQNDRTYSKRIAEKIKACQRLQDRLNMRALVAQGNHPKEGLETDINKIGGVVTKWEFSPDNSQMLGEIEILNTATGRDIYELLKAKIPVGVSARGYGDVDAHGNVLEESYELLTFDLVIDPSFESAITKVQEIMEKYVPKKLKITEVNDTIRNQNTEELKLMFENTEIKRLNMEDAFLDIDISKLRKIDEVKNFDSFVTYAKSYINEVASKYFESESLYSVDYKEFWKIVENIIVNPNIYEVPVLFEKKTLQSVDKETVIDALNRYVIAALNEYNKTIRKTSVKLEENFLFRYLRLVAKTSHLIESSNVMKDLDNNEQEESMENDIKKPYNEADEEEFVVADYEDDDLEEQNEEGEEEAPKKKKKSEDEELDESDDNDEDDVEEAPKPKKKEKEMDESEDAPDKDDYRFYDEDEYKEGNEIDGGNVEKLDGPVTDDPLVDDAEAPKAKGPQSVEDAEKTDAKETTGSEKTVMEPITVTKTEARRIAKKHDISVNEAATLLLSQKIIKKIEMKEGKKQAPTKKRTPVIQKRKRVAESAQKAAPKKPIKMQEMKSVESKKKELTKESTDTLKLCESMFRG